MPVPWRPPSLVGLFLFLCYLLTFPGTIGPRISDGRSMYLVTTGIAARWDVALVDPASPELARGWQRPAPSGPASCPVEPGTIGVGQRVGGPVFAKYGIGQSLAALPLYLLGTAVAALVAAGDRANVAEFVTSAYPALVTALTAALLCALILRLGHGRRAAVAVALLFGLASPAWAYTVSFFSEPTIAICLLAAVASVLWRTEAPSVRAATLAGLWFSAAVLVRLDSAIYIPLFSLFLLARGSRDRRPALLAALAIGPLLALAATGAYNVARFHDPLTTGYGIAGDTHDLHPLHGGRALWEGIYGPLLSPGKGIFLYAPALLLLPWALPRFARATGRGGALLVVGIAAVAVLAHANTLIVWLGGWSWGPRFLIPIVPLLFLPLGVLLSGVGPGLRRLAWALAVLGALIQVPAALLDKGAYISYLRATDGGGCIWRAEDLYKWHPEYTPLFGQWGRLLDASTYTNQRIGLARYAASRSLSPAQALRRDLVQPAPLPWWSLLAQEGVSWDVLLPALGALSALCLLVGLALLGCLGPPVRGPGGSAALAAPGERTIVRY